MRTQSNGNLGATLVSWWRKAVHWAAPQEQEREQEQGRSPRGAMQKLPLIEDVVARAGREPPAVD
jgi:hypothetical protein